MKILFFVNSFPKLSETFILNQITGLIDRGNDITILANSAEKNNKVHADIIKYHLLNRVIYYNPPYKNKIGRAWSFLKNLLCHIISRLFDKNYKGKLSTRKLFRNHSLLYLLNLCNKRNLSFDIISAHFGPNGLLARQLIDLELLKGKLFITFHGYDMVNALKSNNDIYQSLFISDSILLPISSFWGRKLIQLGANPEKIIIHHMGIKVNQFNFSPISPPLKGSKIKILSVARLVEKKGLTYGIDAVKELVKKGYNLKYTIVGRGPLEHELKKKSMDNGLSNIIDFKGWKTQDEVRELMRTADFCILPSIKSSNGDMEGIPVTLMEAMAMGKIVISTYHSGIPELIDNGINGFLVEEKNPKKIANIIVQLMKKSDWHTIEVNARKKIEEYFNIDKLNDDLINIFEKWQE